MGENGPLRPYRIGIRVTGTHYVELEAVNSEHAEGQALVQTIYTCGLPSGSNVAPSSGDVRYPAAMPAKPIEIRLDVVNNIRVVGIEQKS